MSRAAAEASGSRCPSCGASRVAARWDASWRLGDGKSVCWCDACGYGWQQPMPEPAEIHRYYADQPVYNLHGAGEKEELFALRLERLTELRPQRGLVLDVGSGLGDFLALARREGWRVLGVEPQTSAADHCRRTLGIEVHEGFLGDLELPVESVDVLTLWDVLEHVHDPLPFLDACMCLVKPDGLLVMAIPNASGWPARLFRGSWRYVMKTHLSYFSMPYIERLLGQRGWAIRRADHMLKAQSLLYGLAGLIPVPGNPQAWLEEFIRVGRMPATATPNASGPAGSASSPSTLLRTRIRLASTARRLVLRANRTPLPLPVGDLVDLYCERS